MTIDDIIYEGDVVEVEIFPDDGNNFVCWTNNGSIDENGEILGFNKKLSIVMDDNYNIQPNFIEIGSKLIIYNMNGGEVIGAPEQEYLYVIPNVTNYIRPNTLQGTHNFQRDGYTLASYNTEADGSGEVISMGGRVTLPDSGTLNLFLQWKKWTEESFFTYLESDDKLTITKYIGDFDEVVIPEIIDGKLVVAIAANAFSDASMKTVVLPKSITSVDDNAFIDCNALETFVMFDAILDISDESISGCNNFKNLRVNAVLAPRYTNAHSGHFAVKIDRVICSNRPKLIIYAGSNVFLGIDSLMLASEFEDKWQIFNLGTWAGSTSVFYLSILSKLLSDNDVLVFAPEPFNWQLGYPSFNSSGEVWQTIESNYDLLKFLSINDFTNVLTSFSIFNNARQSRQERTYLDYASYINEYGDYIYPRKNRPENGYSVTSTTALSPNVIFDLDNINRFNDIIVEKGAKMYLSFSAVNKDGLAKSTSTVEGRMPYVEAINAGIKFPIISDLEDYLFENKYFFDSNLHLSIEGAKVRTAVLIDDIKKQFEKDGIY